MLEWRGELNKRKNKEEGESPSSYTGCPKGARHRLSHHSHPTIILVATAMPTEVKLPTLVCRHSAVIPSYKKPRKSGGSFVHYRRRSPINNYSRPILSAHQNTRSTASIITRDPLGGKVIVAKRKCTLPLPCRIELASSIRHFHSSNILLYFDFTALPISGAQFYPPF